jgi:uncharacterized protein YkwD
MKNSQRLKLPFLLLISLILSTSGNRAIGADEATAGEAETILSLDQAREYMLTLINRDRAAHGLSPVILDRIASQAGQIQSADMALNNYLGHYGTDGKKPWQRYTQLGGQGYVSENVLWWSAREYEGYEQEAPTDGDSEGKPFTQHGVQAFKKSDIDETESSYYNEVPPNDGHRKCILDPTHNGVGIAFTIATNGSKYRFANTQEFTDNYGQFATLPRDLSQPFYVTGTLSPYWAVQCVSIKWEPAPQPLAPEVINKMESYKHPSKTLENYFAVQWAKQPFQIRSSNGLQQFRVLVTPQNSWKPGLYYVDVIAQYKGGKPTFISRRTIAVPNNN